MLFKIGPPLRSWSLFAGVVRGVSKAKNDGTGQLVASYTSLVLVDVSSDDMSRGNISAREPIVIRLQEHRDCQAPFSAATQQPEVSLGCCGVKRFRATGQLRCAIVGSWLVTVHKGFGKGVNLLRSMAPIRPGYRTQRCLLL